MCLDLILIVGTNLRSIYILAVESIIENLKENNDIKRFNISNLTLVNSTYQPLKANSSSTLYLVNSKIYSKDFLTLDCKNLILKNSSIKAEDTIYLNDLSKIEFNDIIDNAILDTSSYLEAGNKIYIGNSVYQSNTKERLILTQEELEKTIELEKIISILKALNNYTIKINNEQKKLIEQTILSEINKEEEKLKKQIERYINKKRESLSKNLETIEINASKAKVRELVQKNKLLVKDE